MSNVRCVVQLNFHILTECNSYDIYGPWSLLEYNWINILYWNYIGFTICKYVCLWK